MINVSKNETQLNSSIDISASDGQLNVGIVLLTTSKSYTALLEYQKYIIIKRYDLVQWAMPQMC